MHRGLPSYKCCTGSKCLYDLNGDTACADNMRGLCIMSKISICSIKNKKCGIQSENRNSQIKSRYIRRKTARIGNSALILALCILCLAGCSSKNSGLYQVKAQALKEQGEYGEGTSAADGLIDAGDGDICGSAVSRSAGTGALSGYGNSDAEGYIASEGSLSAGNGAENNRSIDGQTVEDTGYSVFVHICGAVNNPGVYELTSGDRVCDAVNSAGGFDEDAKEDYVNLAQLLEDGMKIVIPTTEQAEEETLKALEASGASHKSDYGITEGETGKTGNNAPDAVSQTGSLTEKININTADAAALCTISGIGPAKAAAIIEYRESVGLFLRREDIMKVSGIGEGTYARIKDEITTENE